MVGRKRRTRDDGDARGAGDNHAPAEVPRARVPEANGHADGVASTFSADSGPQEPYATTSSQLPVMDDNQLGHDATPPEATRIAPGSAVGHSESESDGERRAPMVGREDSGVEEDEDDDDEDEEEILVVLELADFKNHPILDDYRSITLEGIDTAKPKLHIGEYSLHGQLEETVGTHFFYDTKNRTENNEYRLVGQTTKKIKFTITPPGEYYPGA